MKNKNVYIMKQPDLGKRILELRKSRGLTQEELVEKCNINVRTIQRIEAGEVTPRSFTIKTILEVLGVDSESFFGLSSNQLEDAQFLKEDVSALRNSWIAGFFFTIFAIIGMTMEAILLSSDDFDDALIYRAIYGVFSLTSLFFFLRGYKVLGDRYKNNTLVGATYIYFIIEFLIVVTTILLTIFEFDENVLEIITGVVIILVFGLGELILGLGIQKLKDQLGSFAQVVGIFKIVNGAMFITIILSSISIFLSIPILIMEVILLYQTTQKISPNHS